MISRRVYQFGQPCRVRDNFVGAAVERDLLDTILTLRGQLAGRSALNDDIAGRSCGAARALPQRMVVAVLFLGGCFLCLADAFGERCAEPLSHALRERGKFHVAHEAEKSVRERRPYGRIGKRNVQRRLCI